MTPRTFTLATLALLLAGVLFYLSALSWLKDCGQEQARETHKLWVAKERQRQCELAFPINKRQQHACTEGRL